MFIGLAFDPTLIVSCTGLVIGAIGGISSRSAMLKFSLLTILIKRKNRLTKKNFEK